MIKIRKIASFLRWRLVPVRYLTMLLDMKWSYLLKSHPVISSVCKEVELHGYHVAPPLDNESIKEIQAVYRPRAVSVVPQEHGHPFVNLFTEEDLRPDNPVVRLAFSSKILEVAADYFGNKLVLDSIQVLHSYSTSGDVRESQFWHLDYGDRKSFHAIVYLNDVTDSDDGPFVFVNKDTSREIGRSLVVRRIGDAQFDKELGKGQSQQFLGPSGAMVYVDPASCYHYGSRCRDSRLAVFVTFNSWFPYAKPAPLIQKNREVIYDLALKIRPDLNRDFLKSLLKM